MTLFVSLCSGWRQTEWPIVTASYKLLLWRRTHFKLRFQMSMNSRNSFKLYIGIPNFCSKLCIFLQYTKLPSLRKYGRNELFLNRNEDTSALFSSKFFSFSFDARSSEAFFWQSQISYQIINSFRSNPLQGESFSISKSVSWLSLSFSSGSRATERVIKRKLVVGFQLNEVLGVLLMVDLDTRFCICFSCYILKFSQSKSNSLCDDLLILAKS